MVLLLQVWAALMGINLVGVQHTTQLAYEEAASSLGSVALEVLQTSEFSQYHEVRVLPRKLPAYSSYWRRPRAAAAVAATSRSAVAALRLLETLMMHGRSI